MSIFDNLLRIADASIDAVHAEPFVMRPMKRGPNGRATADVQRQVVQGRGVFDYRAGDAGGIQTGSSRSFSRSLNDMKTIVSGRTPQLSIDDRQLACVTPCQGDVVELPERVDEKRFEVVSAQPDGHGRVVLELVER